MVVNFQFGVSSEVIWQQHYWYGDMTQLVNLKIKVNNINYSEIYEYKVRKTLYMTMLSGYFMVLTHQCEEK